LTSQGLARMLRLLIFACCVRENQHWLELLE
jgi:hypothetical protein